MVPQSSTPRRQPLSAFVICGNEEADIAACLETLTFCDEIVVVDSFSEDRTFEIVKRYTERAYQRKWTNYRDQKAYASGLTTHDWVFNIDSDERVTPELERSIIKAMEDTANGSEIVGYYVSRLVYHLGRWWNRGGWYPEYRLRVFRKSRVQWAGGEVHEKPVVNGPTARLTGELLHYSFRDLREQITKYQRFAELSADDAHRQGKRARLWNLVLNPLWRFFKFYFVKKGYREGVAGFVVAVLEGYYTFIKYARLWEYGISAVKSPVGENLPHQERSVGNGFHDTK